MALDTATVRFHLSNRLALSLSDVLIVLLFAGLCTLGRRPPELEPVRLLVCSPDPFPLSQF